MLGTKLQSSPEMLELKHFLEKAVYIDGIEADNPILATEMATTATIIVDNLHSYAPGIPSSSSNLFLSVAASGSREMNTKLSQKQEPEKLKFKKTNRLLIATLVILVLIIISGALGIYFMLNSQKVSESVPTSTPTPIISTATATTTATKTSKTITRTPFPKATVTTILKSSNLTGVHGITLDDEDNIYVIIPPPYPHNTMPGYPYIYRVNQGSSASVTLVANLSTDGQPRYNGNQGICYYNRALYVPRGGQLTKIDLDNNNLVTRFAGSGTTGAIENGLNSSAVFNGAKYCIADKDGNIYVTESNGAIRKVDQNGDVGTLIIPGLTAPFGISINGTNNLLISSWGLRTIQSLDLKSNELTTIVGNSTGLQAIEGLASFVGLIEPAGLTMDELGNLYFAQRGAHSIWKKNATNHVTLFAGIGVGVATFNSPWQLVFDSKGRIFMTENTAVRMINW